MRVTKVLVALLATVVFFVLLAQSDADYQGFMKAAVASKGKVAKGIAAKDGPGTAADAKAMEASFKQIEDYWSKKGAADAVGFATHWVRGHRQSGCRRRFRCRQHRADLGRDRLRRLPHGPPR